MCGRFMLTSPVDSLRRIFEVQTTANIPARYNIAPMQPTLIVRRAEEDGGTTTPAGQREMVAVQWGLVPSWMKEQPTSRPMINARSETVAQKPSFRSAFRRRHCLVPADGWYEWKNEEGGKQPYLIRPAGKEDRPFALAGIWERWHGPSGEDWLETMAILTMPACPSLAAIHDRMPVVLDRQSHDHWLQLEPETGEYPRTSNALNGLSLLEDGFETQPVSRRLNNVRHDDPGVLEASVGTQHSLF